MLFDVSLPITSKTFVYPGNPPVDIQPQQSIAAGGSSNVSVISFGSHTATHVDAQRHFVDGGAAVDDIPLDVLIGPALLIDIPGEAPAITLDHLSGIDLATHARVLFRTRNSTELLARDEFVRDYTYLSPEAAAHLVAAGVRLVGIDYLSIEQFRSGHHRTHHTLLGANVVIIEGLDFSRTPPGEYELICLPLRLAGLDGSPARVILRSR
jgi:arylformamidase